MTEEKDLKELLSHVDDLLARAAAGAVCCTAFLTPREIAYVMQMRAQHKSRIYPYGGFKAAERRRLFCLPDYIADAEEPYRTEWLQPDLEKEVVCLRIKGSGFRTLSHKDHLGALMHLGLARDALGDVIVTGEHEALVFCGEVVARLILSDLARVANDKVTPARFTPPAGFDGGRRFIPVTGTVASPRADAVVAALANLSREEAAAAFREGRVEIDYLPAEKPDRPLLAGQTVVIRGCGKFIIRGLSDKTKKGRYRLLADKYD